MFAVFTRWYYTYHISTYNFKIKYSIRQSSEHVRTSDGNAAPFQLATPGISSQPHPEGEPCFCMYEMHRFCALATLSLCVMGVFSRSWVRRTQVHACTLGASWGPGRAPWRVLWASKVAASWLFSRGRFPPSHSLAGRREPSNKKAGFRMFRAEYDSSHLAWSPGHLRPRAWSPGRLATWHLGPPCVQQQSRFESRCFCVCTWYTFQDDKMEISGKQRVRLIARRGFLL